MWKPFSGLHENVHDCLHVGWGPSLLLIHRSLPGKQVGGVSTSEAGLDVEHGHVSPAGGIVVRGGGGAGGAWFVLDQLEEGLHVRAQPGDDAGPHRHHCLLVTGLQRLQQGAVVPAHRQGVMSAQWHFVLSSSITCI